MVVSMIASFKIQHLTNTTLSCSQCRRIIRLHQQACKVYERDRKGKITGQIFFLCPDCEVDFYRREIKNAQQISTDNKSKLIKHFNFQKETK